MMLIIKRKIYSLIHYLIFCGLVSDLTQRSDEMTQGIPAKISLSVVKQGRYKRVAHSESIYIFYAHEG